MIDVIDKLSVWFLNELRRLGSHQTWEECELLLCASDLGVKSPRATRMLHQLQRDEPSPESESGALTLALRRQFVFMRYNQAIESRKRFLEYWIISRRFKSLDRVTTCFLMELALEQAEFLSSDTINLVQHWFDSYIKLRAIQARAWAAYGLHLSMKHDIGRALALEVLSQREENGSWSNDIEKTLNTAYPLALSELVSIGELDATIRYVVNRYNRGFVRETIFANSQTLRLLSVSRQIPEGVLDDLRLHSGQLYSIFISYSHKDKEFVDRLLKDLSAENVRAWLDEAEINPGDSIMRKIENGLSEVDYVGIILSNNSVESEWVRKEMDMGLISSLGKQKIGIVPIVIEDCEVPLSLRDLYWADFRQSYENGLAKLMRTLLQTKHS
jgi:TIR domain